MKFQTIESTRLSSGQLMEIRQAGRKYNFILHGLGFNEPPDIINGLNKKDAYEAFTTHLRADVLEMV